MKIEIDFKNKKNLYINLLVPIILSIGISLIVGSTIPLGTMLILYGIYGIVYGDVIYKLISI